MRVGLSMSSSLRSDDPAQAGRWMIERARAADAAELDSLSLGDQHASAWPYYQNTPMLGRLLAEWRTRPAGCLFLLPLWHPVLVAEQVGTLAALTPQPFIVQTGIGGGAEQFAALGADLSTRGRVLEEGIRVIKALLAGEPVDSPLVGGPVTLGLRPAQPVEWWIAGGSPVAVRRAATMGDAWYASPATTAGDDRALSVYLDACREVQATPRPIVRKDVIVLSEPGRAEALAAQMVADGYRGMGLDAVAAGEPAQVAEHFSAFAEVGYTDVICRCMSADQAVALETIELLGEVRAQLRPGK